MQVRTRSTLHNPLTYAGLALAAVALSLIVLLYAIELSTSHPHPYMGIITFMVLPGVFNVGLIVAIVGLVRAWKRRRAGIEDAPNWPRLDLNSAVHRRNLLLVATGGLLFLAISAFGSYQAYEFTDSVDFCGRTCHAVMNPEYTAYQASPHARVACVECHIGPGATWFVRSKLSGSYQVYAALTKRYPRPIPTPVENLRPARETCEQCHWPRQFYGAKLEHRNYYLSDEHNTLSQVDLLMKIGGGNSHLGAPEGIHYHMYLSRNISYVATDRERNNIPYVEVKEPDGSKRIYRSTDSTMSDTTAQKCEKHVVDCIECHNRPTHIFHHPAQSVDLALSQGWISPQLPSIKQAAVTALEQPYRTDKEAQDGIRKSLEDYYHTTSPLPADQQPLLEAAIHQTQTIYRQNYFPEMKVSWKAFPDHLGHMYSPGCFRCHDGKHVSSDGKVLSKDCNLCHTILSEQTANSARRTSVSGLQFQHPMEIDDTWKEMPCSDCHAGQK